MTTFVYQLVLHKYWESIKINYMDNITHFHLPGLHQSVYYVPLQLPNIMQNDSMASPGSNKLNGTCMILSKKVEYVTHVLPATSLF